MKLKFKIKLDRSKFKLYLNKSKFKLYLNKSKFKDLYRLGFQKFVFYG